MAPAKRRRAGAAITRVTGAERRKLLLTHAKQLFVTLGYPQTTPEIIAATAGVSEAVLRRHFKSKQLIFLAVLQEIRDATIARWSAPSADPADTAVRLHALVDLYFGSLREHALEFRIVQRALLESTDDEEMRTLLRDFFLEIETPLADLIAEGQQSGVFRRSLDARVGAWQIIHTLLGHRLTEPLAVPLHGEEDYRARAVDCLLHCLLKTDV